MNTTEPKVYNATGLSDQDLRWMQKTFDRCDGLRRVVLFGSRALGTAKKGSDIDLAVWCNSERDIAALSDALNEDIPLPYKFDVVDFKTIRNLDLIAHIDRFGVTLFENAKKMEPQL